MVEKKNEEILEEKKDEKKKNVFEKVKDAILPDQEEQAEIISTFVRLGVLIWSGGILTLNYVSIPGIPFQCSRAFWLDLAFRQPVKKAMEL